MLVLYSVASPDRALAEARRVLRPAGRLIVLEHVRSGSLARWQDRLTPVWSRINAGCHLNRDIAAAVRRAGFTVETAESFDPYPRWVPPGPCWKPSPRPAPEWPPVIPDRAVRAIRTMAPSAVVVTGGRPIVRLVEGQREFTMKEDRNDSTSKAQPDP